MDAAMSGQDEPAAPILDIRGIAKRFGATIANAGVDLTRDERGRVRFRAAGGDAYLDQHGRIWYEQHAATLEWSGGTDGIGRYDSDFWLDDTSVGYTRLVLREALSMKDSTLGPSITIAEIVI